MSSLPTEIFALIQTNFISILTTVSDHHNEFPCDPNPCHHSCYCRESCQHENGYVCIASSLMLVGKECQYSMYTVLLIWLILDIHWDPLSFPRINFWKSFYCELVSFFFIFSPQVRQLLNFLRFNYILFLLDFLKKKSRILYLF